nr:RNA-directed DNA polymerase, eukaryota [Tanacetum cinerariifolium]
MLDMEKKVLVAAKLGYVSIDVSFRRGVRDGVERQQWDDLQSLMQSVFLSSSGDRWICDLSGDGEYRVKEVRNFIDDLFLPSHPEVTRWVKCIPKKINIFVWRAHRDCLPTRQNLIRRGVVLESDVCPLCEDSVEEPQHNLTSFSDWQAWFLSIRLPSKTKMLLEGVFYVAWVGGTMAGKDGAMVPAQHRERHTVTSLAT